MRVAGGGAVGAEEDCRRLSIERVWPHLQCWSREGLSLKHWTCALQCDRD